MEAKDKNEITSHKFEMDRNPSDKWGSVRRYIEDSRECPVSQTDIVDFLKSNFQAALDLLEQMDPPELDLDKEDILTLLKKFEEALLLLPKRRVHIYDAAIVYEMFEDLVIRFYRILAAPIQNAENSFTCDWLVNNLKCMADNPEDVTIETLDIYLSISNILIKNSSNKVKVYLEEAIEALAHALVSAGEFSLAKQPWEYAIRLLSDETNFMISQRFDRMCAASDMYKHLYKSGVQETN